MSSLDLFYITIFDMWMALLITHGVHKELKTTWVSRTIYILLMSVLVPIISLLNTRPAVNHVLCGIAGFIVFVIYMYHAKEKRKSLIILLFFLNMLISLAVQFALIIMMKLVFGHVEISLTYALISQPLATLIIYLLMRFLPFHYFYTFIVKGNAYFIISITSVAAIYYGISIFWHMDNRNITEAISTSIIVLVVVVVINMFLLQDGRLSAAYKERLDVYNTYFPIIDDMVDELRKNQHDYHNQIQTILAMAQSGQPMKDEMDTYVKGIMEKSTWTDLLKMENRILAAFLYSKYKDALKSGVKINYSINNFSDDTVFTEYELVDLYGILLDNAIYATGHYAGCKACGETEIGNLCMVKVEIGKKEHRNFLKVVNVSDYISTNEIGDFFKEGFTTKEASTGLGLYKLKEMVNKNGGDLYFYYDTDHKAVVVEILYY